MNTPAKIDDYKLWLVDLKTRIRQSQIKAAVRVNSELIELYWSIGADIVAKQAETAWGSGVIKQLSTDLKEEFPHLSGFSETNLLYMKRFYLFYNQDITIWHQLGAKLERKNLLPKSHQFGVQLQTLDNQQDIIQPQLVAELAQQIISQIPWGHHREIISKCKTLKEAAFYIQKTIEDGWSRAVLINCIEADLYSRQGKALKEKLKDKN